MEIEVSALIDQIRNVNKMFRKACQQVVILNNKLNQLLVHYCRAGRNGQKNHRYSRRIQIATVEGIRNMYYNYAARQCEVMDDLQDTLKDIAGYEYDFNNDRPVS